MTVWPGTTNGWNGLKCHWNSPSTVMITNGASTITPKIFEESPTSFAPRMLSHVKIQITDAPSSHRASAFVSKIGK